MHEQQTYSVRFHGRGGQGVVTSAELLAAAAFTEGRHAQAFPTFGSERTGAPVTSYCRISDRPIRSHDPVTEPDAVVVQDPTLLHDPAVLAGVGPDTLLLVNSARSLAALGLTAANLRAGRGVTIAATEIAREHLGRPLPGSALLGALAAVTGQVSLEALTAAVRRRFTGAVGEDNAAAVAQGHRAALESDAERVDA